MEFKIKVGTIQTRIGYIFFRFYLNHLALMAAAGVGESIHAGIDLGAAIAWAGRGRVDCAIFIAGISNDADAIIRIYRGAAVLGERIWKLTVGVDQDSGVDDDRPRIAHDGEWVMGIPWRRAACHGGDEALSVEPGTTSGIVARATASV